MIDRFSSLWYSSFFARAAGLALVYALVRLGVDYLWPMAPSLEGAAIAGVLPLLLYVLVPHADFDLKVLRPSEQEGQADGA